jgi:hypothetical protein
MSACAISRPVRCASETLSCRRSGEERRRKHQRCKAPYVVKYTTWIAPSRICDSARRGWLFCTLHRTGGSPWPCMIDDGDFIYRRAGNHTRARNEIPGDNFAMQCHRAASCLHRYRGLIRYLFEFIITLFGSLSCRVRGRGDDLSCIVPQSPQYCRTRHRDGQVL